MRCIEQFADEPQTLVEQTTETSVDTSTKSELATTQEDDLSDAVKTDNQRDTKLAVNGSGGANWAVYHAEASASFRLRRLDTRSIVSRTFLIKLAATARTPVSSSRRTPITCPFT